MAENKNLISGATGDWEIVLGLEVHAQVASNAKLFSGAATEFGAEPNSPEKCFMMSATLCSRCLECEQILRVSSFEHGDE